MESLEQTLRRLDREREEADRRYNDALTALDRGLPRPGDWPSPGRTVDDSQLPSINDAWNTAPAAPEGQPGWRGRLAGFIWRTMAPYLQRQASFNSRLVDHLNRNAAAANDAHHRAEETTARLREEFAKLAVFHALTIQYLQQMTAYIDTRDRRAAGGALVLNASLSGLAENVDKRWESLGAQQARVNAGLTDLSAHVAATSDELRAMVGVAQQGTLSLKREVERILSGQAESPSAENGRQDVQVSAPGVFRALDSYKYVGFEDEFRGSREDISARLESYLPAFAGAGDVLDIGCGRGEFLELLAGAGIRARGIDVNHEMAELCRSRGLDVVEADAVGYLSTLPDASLGGIFAAQVVEHLQPAYLLQFLELAFHKIRPGGRMVLETLNPACWAAFFDSYIRDITHVWPLHPETLKYFVLASGFTRADLEFRSPVAVEDRLQSMGRVDGVAGTNEQIVDLVDAFNENVAKLNARLFTYRDYAIVATR